ncbi:MAG: SLBB domain-containing protein [Ignavibacteriaceae bacterium]
MNREIIFKFAFLFFLIIGIQLFAQSEKQSPIIPSEGTVDPKEYKIGPGDVFYLSIKGIEEYTFNLMVTPEGSVYIPKVGGVDLSDLNLFDAKEKIKNKILTGFKNVEIFISLANYRTIKVFLHGNVKNSGTMVLTANSRLADLFNNYELFLERTDFRNIRVTNNSGNVSLFDYIAVSRFGAKTNNPLLEDGSYIYVDKIDHSVTIMGAVKFPGAYPYVENEEIKSLIEIAGGITKKAKEDTIEVIGFENDLITQKSTFYSLNDILNNTILLRKGDIVVIREVPKIYEEKVVTINGYVKFPGVYKIIDNETTLFQVIESAGGFMSEASLVDATLTRTMGIKESDPEFERLKLISRENMTEDEYDYLKSRSRQRAGKIVVDFVRLFESGDKSEDLVLRKGDIIDIPEEKNFIVIIGQAVNPGKIPFNSKYTVDDYIRIAGGFGWRALESDVRVIKVNTGEWVDADDVEELEPGDTIWILEDPPPPKFWDVFTTTLIILGQVATVIAATIAVIVSTR